MTPLRKTNNFPHEFPALKVMGDRGTILVSRELHFRDFSNFRFRAAPCAAVKHASVLFRASVNVLLCMRRSFSCRQRCEVPGRYPLKTTEQLFKAKNSSSFPTSQECSGPTKPQLISQPPPGVASEQLSIISPANANGLATRSLRLLLRFCGAAKCETSKSVHGHKRRAF
jgi:hypothetical protein